MKSEATMDTAKRLVATGKAEFRKDKSGGLARQKNPDTGKWYYVMDRFDKGCTQLVRVPSTEENK